MTLDAWGHDGTRGGRSPRRERSTSPHRDRHWGRRPHHWRRPIGPILSWPILDRKRYYKPWKSMYPGWYRQYKYGHTNPIFWRLVDRYPPEHVIWRNFKYYDHNDPYWYELERLYL